MCVGWADEYFGLWDYHHFTVERSRVLSGGEEKKERERREGERRGESGEADLVVCEDTTFR